jgi:hypothetical protein
MIHFRHLGLIKGEILQMAITEGKVGMLAI